MDKIIKNLSKGLHAREYLISEIKKGSFGETNSQFPTVRTIAAEYGISLVTAQKIVFMLRDGGFLKKEGKRYILTGNKPGSERPLRIGVMIATLDNPFFAALLKYIELAAAKQKIEIMGVSNNYIVEREKELLDVFVREKFDGILACPCNPQASALNFGKLNLPYVLIGSKVKNIESDAVLVQNFSAGQTVARHLISSGKKNFGYIGLKDYPCDPRLQGFRSGLAEDGYNLEDDNIINASSDRLDDILPEMETFLRKLHMPTGIFCFHDILAERLMRVASEMKIKIPADLGVVGFDNLPIAARLAPGLSSVAYPIDRMAEMAIEMLVSRINGDKGRFVSNFIDPVLIPRGSTIKAKTEHKYMHMNQKCLAYNLA